jgi:hypothetical protein
MQLSRLWSSKAKLQGAGVGPVPAIGPATDAKISSAIERLKLDWAPRYAEHWQHFESANLTDLAPMARELWHNGLVRIDAALTKLEVSDAIRELRALGGVFSGDYAGPIPYVSLRKDGIAALEVAEQTPICLELLTRNDVLPMARAVYGDGMNIRSRTASIKYGQGDKDSSNVPHWDHWKPRLKMFLYLTDVTEDSAPTIYLRGTNHRDKPSFRFNKDFATQFIPGATTGGSWVPFYGDEQYEPVTFTAPAGTAFIFDARGVHAGQALASGHRLMLTSMYTPDPYGFVPY